MNERRTELPVIHESRGGENIPQVDRAGAPQGESRPFAAARARPASTLRQRVDHLQRLLDATLRLHGLHDLDAVLQEVADSARTVLGCRYAALGVLAPSGATLESFIVSGMTRDQVERLGALPSGKGVLGLLIKDRRPIRLTDLSQHHESYGVPDGHPPMKSFLGVPVIGRSGAIGNLYFTEKYENDFTAEDEAAAQVLAAEAALAVETARLISELRTLQATRDRFYAMVNHELRNALTGVYGWSEMLLRSAGDDPPRAVRETVEAAEYALELLNDLLDLSRLAADKLHIEIEETDAGQVAMDAVKVVKPDADQDGIVIGVTGVDQPVPSETDATRLRQVLVNLLRNAVRHSGSPDIRLELRTDNETIEFTVTDFGMGITPDHLAIIFDAYQRAANQAGGGAGLGLSLCKRVAQLLGGDISVRSAPGEGASFTVRIARYLRPLPDEGGGGRR